MKIILLIRALITDVVVVVATLLTSVVSIIGSLLKIDRISQRAMRIWAKLLLLMTGSPVEVLGLENISELKDQGAVLLFNHQSHFDIPILCHSFPYDLRFGAKQELYAIPVFGYAMKLAGMIPINRTNRTEVFKQYQENVEVFTRGINVALAPEGTRQNQAQIGGFKKGPFHFAKSAGVKVVPVVIKGAFDILPKTSLLPGLKKWHNPVVVSFLKPVVLNEKLEISLKEVQDVFVKEYERILI